MKVGAVPNHHFTADSGLEESPGRYFRIEAAGQDKVGIGRVNLKLRNRGQSLDTAFTFLTDKGTGAFNVFLISEHDLPGGIRQGTDGPGIFGGINPAAQFPVGGDGIAQTKPGSGPEFRNTPQHQEVVILSGQGMEVISDTEGANSA